VTPTTAKKVAKNHKFGLSTMQNIIKEKNWKKGMCELAREYAEYAKSEAP